MPLRRSFRPLLLSLLMLCAGPALAMEGKPAPAGDLIELIRLAEAGLAGFELEPGEMTELAEALTESAPSQDVGDADRRLAGRAYRLSARQLLRCTQRLEVALTAGESEDARKLFKKEFIPLCLDLAVCRAAASPGATLPGMPGVQP